MKIYVVNIYVYVSDMNKRTENKRTDWTTNSEQRMMYHHTSAIAAFQVNAEWSFLGQGVEFSSDAVTSQPHTRCGHKLQVT